MNEPNDIERAARGAWRSQTLNAPQLTVQFVRHQADRLDQDRRREMRIIWAALGACLLLTVTIIANPHGAIVNPMSQTLGLASVLLLAGCAYLVYELSRRSRAATAQVDGLVENLSAYRSELRNRRDLYRHGWRWSIWPMLPALSVIFVGGGLYDDRPGKLWRYGACAVLAIVGTALGIIHYRRKGDELQRELDALDSLGA